MIGRVGTIFGQHGLNIPSAPRRALARRGQSMSGVSETLLIKREWRIRVPRGCI